MWIHLLSPHKVGHNALGAGRVFDQGAKLVANAIDDGSFKVSQLTDSLHLGK